MKLVSLPIIATNGGPVQPVEAIGAVARDVGVWFLLDACQGVGHVPLDVAKTGCHMLAATSRKYLRGPRGVGFLYVERELCGQLEPPFLDLHAAMLQTPDRFEIQAGARRFENWECNAAAKLGMGVAIDYALECGVELLWISIQALATRLRERLQNIDGVTIRDTGPVQSGIVTFTIDGCDPGEVVQRLARHPKRINVSCSTFRSTMLDMQMRGLKELVRASVHAYNSDEEIETLVLAVEAVSREKASVR